MSAANVSATCTEVPEGTPPCDAGSCLDGHGAGLPHCDPWPDCNQTNSTTPAAVISTTPIPTATPVNNNTANATNATSSNASAVAPSSRKTMDPADAAALAGTVSTVVGAVIAGVVAATAAGAIPPNPGAMALIGQVQVLSQIGRIGGGGGGAMVAFSDGFAWAHGNGLYTMFPEGNDTRRRSFRRQQEDESSDGLSPIVGKTAGEASGDCDAPELTEREKAKCLECGMIDGAPMLDKLVGIVVSLGVVFVVRFSAQLIMTKCCKKEPWAMLTFPNWEGPLLLTHWFSMCDSLTTTLGRPCAFWIVLSCVLLFFGPIAFILYAMWRIANNLKKGLMTYEERQPISFKETREKFNQAGTLGGKFKAISEYYDRRRHKGEWNENTEQGMFWRFLVKDFSEQAWKYCVWLLIRKFLFAIAMSLTIGAANAGAVIFLHIFDIGVLAFMNPFCDNVFQGSEMLSSFSNLFSMILASMPVLYGDVPEALSDFMIICFALVGTVMAVFAAIVTPIVGSFGAAAGLCMSAMPDGLEGVASGGASGALVGAAAHIRDSVQELIEDGMDEMAADGEWDGEGGGDIGEDAALLGVGAAAVGGAAYYAHKRSQALRDGMDTSCTTANATLTLGLEFIAAGEEGSSERKVFENQLVQDLANASEVAASRFDIKKMSPGSIVVDLDIVADPMGKGPDSASVVKLLEEQASNPDSLLRTGSVTCHTQSVCNNGPSVPVAQLIDEQAFCSDVKQSLRKTQLDVENSSTAFAHIQGDMPPKRAVPAPPSLRVTAAAATIQAESIDIMMEPGPVRRKDEWALSLARRRKLLYIFLHWSNCALGKPLTPMEKRASVLAQRKRLAWFFGDWYSGISNRRMNDLIDAGGVMTRHFDVFGAASPALGRRLAAKILRRWADYALGDSSNTPDARLKAVFYRKVIAFQYAVSKGRSATILKDAMMKWLWITKGFCADKATTDILSPSDVRNEIYVSSPPVHMYMSSPSTPTVSPPRDGEEPEARRHTNSNERDFRGCYRSTWPRPPPRAGGAPRSPDPPGAPPAGGGRAQGGPGARPPPQVISTRCGVHAVEARPSELGRLHIQLPRANSDERLDTLSARSPTPTGSVFSKRSSERGFACDRRHSVTGGETGIGDAAGCNLFLRRSHVTGAETDGQPADLRMDIFEPVGLRVDIVEPVTGYDPDDARPERSLRIRSRSLSHLESLTRNDAGLERSPMIHSGSSSNVESFTRSSIYGSHIKSHKAHADLEACYQPSDSESRASGNSAGHSSESTVLHGEGSAFCLTPRDGTSVNVAANATRSAPQQLNGLVSDLIGAALIGPQFLEQKLRCLSRNQSSLSNIVASLEEGLEGQDSPVLQDPQSISPWGSGQLSLKRGNLDAQSVSPRAASSRGADQSGLPSLQRSSLGEFV
jgi:hypothetical protein